MVRVADPHGELPIKNHKYVKNCTELYLAQRGIQKLANFDEFVNLEVLWINDNEISTLDGLDPCFRIKSLHAHNNRIRSLDGSSLTRFKFLEELRLYGNRLKDLQSTLHVLGRLQHLHELDLFDNPVAEEENYRYLVVAAIPSLRVLDRHVVTDEDRERAARLIQRVRRREMSGSGQHQVDEQLSKQSKSNRQANIPGAPPQQISGTVSLLMKEVAAAKRDQQLREIREAQRELQELERTRLQTLSVSVHPGTTRDSSIGFEVIPGLDEWETGGLKKFYRSLEPASGGGIHRVALEKLGSYLRTRGFELSNQQGKITFERIQITEPIKWTDFMQMFASTQMQCQLMEPEQLRLEAERCFNRCQVLEHRLQSLSRDDTATMEELQQQSQQGYRLRALADRAAVPDGKPPTALRGDNTRSSSDETGARSRFCFTTFARETLSPSKPPDHPFSNKNHAFHDLQAKSADIDDKLRKKYKLRGKDFQKYIAKQGPQPLVALVRRRVNM